MIRAEFDEEIRRGLEDLIGRTEPIERLEPAQFARKVSSHPWSLGQQFDHLNIADRGMMVKLKEALANAPNTNDNTVDHTLLGKMIIRGAGPGGNVPVPKGFGPGPGPFTAEVAREYSARLREFRQLLQDAAYKDICGTKIKSPMSSIVKYSVADAFAIIVAHGQRHLEQSEFLLRN